MNDRIRRHAEILVDYCTEIGPEDNVLIRAPTPAEDLVVALYERIGERGARPTTEWVHRRANRAYAREMEHTDYRTKDDRLAAMKETDVVILIKAARNRAESSDVDPAKGRAASRAKQPILEERLETRWVITQHPTPAGAQQAEMSTDAWAEYVYDAIDRDWSAQREFQRQLADVLDAADTVRIVSGETTDLRLSVTGMGVINDAGKKNMPAGEVATSPVPDSVEGEIAFDQPLYRNSREIRDVRLEFEDGEVVDYAAGRNEAVLASLLETDAGARRVGEFGVGMNRGIDRVTDNILFDEKMGETVHIALGNAMAECVPDDRPFNESAVHADMLVDMSEASRIEVDGEIIQRNGVFRFEDEFDEP
ncbi:aminopeptidase [Natronorubrum sp. JWXQ-INN-674]|uniref:Aminopeptidase n=1 Tax=Natronorubrum halalkaliphilum TaxID=2691917 RepID=A0A6B0VMN7_9EURY|nr:aminopeptidase [Natronorubrum halalkaliphilum]MXV62022.1 aminopeptidase [Natronorubrum halalkaliphilum]